MTGVLVIVGWLTVYSFTLVVLLGRIIAQSDQHLTTKVGCRYKTHIPGICFTIFSSFGTRMATNPNPTSSSVRRCSATAPRRHTMVARSPAGRTRSHTIKSTHTNQIRDFKPHTPAA